MPRLKSEVDAAPNDKRFPQPGSGPTPAEVLTELDKILAHPLFENSKQLSAFLRFTVETTLDHKSDLLKEYVIGVEVFKRNDSFSPREDPAVRVAAGRLRSKLAEYYHEAGQADPVVIQLPRGGYVPRFDRRCRPVEPAAAVHGQLIPTRSASTKAVAAIALFAAAAAIWLLPRTSVVRQPATPVSLTSYPGQEVEPSFSPDGKQVAFSWNGARQDNFDIYIKEIEKDNPVRLTTDSRRDFGPAWSPDGRTIAFGRILNSFRSAVYLIPAAGGTERMLVESVPPAAFRPGPFVAWSPDGKWLAYSDVDDAGGQLSPTGSAPVSLFLISTETGEKRMLTSHPPNSVGDSGPAFAPDGHALAFIRTRTLAASKLYRLPLRHSLLPSGEPRPVMSDSIYTSSPSWSPDGKEIIFASGPWSRLQLWRVAETGTPGPQRIALSYGHANEPTVSRRGQLAYSERSTDVNIWRTELSGPGKAGTAATLFAASTLSDSSPSFSPDGKHVVFASDRGGTREIWVCDADGSNTRLLTAMAAPMTGSPSWSPDGSRIVFDSNPEGQFDLYTVAATGGAVARLTNTPADEAHGRWSPDGRWIYFMSSRSRQRQVWKMPASGGEAVQVTKNGGVVPFPTSDREFLYYSERAGQRESDGLGGLRRLRLSDGRDEPVLPSVTYLNVTLAREGIYFIPRAEPGGFPSVHFFNFKTKQVTPVIRLTGPVSQGLALSPDGRSLLYTQIDWTIGDLMLVEDYRRTSPSR